MLNRFARDGLAAGHRPLLADDTETPGFED
jgi:hypothetical protein